MGGSSGGNGGGGDVGGGVGRACVGRPRICSPLRSPLALGGVSGEHLLDDLSRARVLDVVVAHLHDLPHILIIYDLSHLFTIILGAISGGVALLVVFVEHLVILLLLVVGGGVVGEYAVERTRPVLVVKGVGERELGESERASRVWW